MEYAKKYLPLRSAALTSSLRSAEGLIGQLIEAQSAEDICSGLRDFADLSGAWHLSLLSSAPVHTAHYAMSPIMDSYVDVYVEKGLMYGGEPGAVARSA